MSEKILFEETQRFNQWWIWLILIIIVGATLPLCFIEGTSWGTKLMPILLSMLVFLFIIVLRLKTKITEDYIQIKYFPILSKTFYWKDLNYAQVVDYGFVGGWGIRLWTGYGTVYNVRGSKGLHIKFENKEYVIGTQREEELRTSIAHLLK